MGTGKKVFLILVSVLLFLSSGKFIHSGQDVGGGVTGGVEQPIKSKPAAPRVVLQQFESNVATGGSSASVNANIGDLPWFHPNQRLSKVKKETAAFEEARKLDIPVVRVKGKTMVIWRRRMQGLVEGKSLLRSTLKYMFIGAVGGVLSGGIELAGMGVVGKALSNWALKRVGMRNALR